MVGDSASPTGRARLGAGKWVLAKHVNGEWVAKGTVSSKVKGQFAAGALRFLLWK